MFYIVKIFDKWELNVNLIKEIQCIVDYTVFLQKQWLNCKFVSFLIYSFYQLKSKCRKSGLFRCNLNKDNILKKLPLHNSNTLVTWKNTYICTKGQIQKKCMYEVYVLKLFPFSYHFFIMKVINNNYKKVMTKESYYFQGNSL